MSDMRVYSQPSMPVASAKCTVISIVPFDILESKPGLIPTDYPIPACPDDDVVCVTIDQAIHYVYIDKDRGSMRVLDPSYEVARSIIEDYCNAQLEAGVGCHPGIMWKLGEWTPEQVKVHFAEELAELRRIQNNWFMAIVKLGDDDWEKTRQHHAISDTQRIAAKKLDPTNSRQRPWIMINPSDVVPGKIDMTICAACGSDIPTSVVLCRYCGYVLDPERHKEMQFAKHSGAPPAIDFKQIRM